VAYDAVTVGFRAMVRCSSHPGRQSRRLGEGTFHVVAMQDWKRAEYHVVFHSLRPEASPFVGRLKSVVATLWTMHVAIECTEAKLDRDQGDTALSH
jgi:hypothetical protein